MNLRDLVTEEGNKGRDAAELARLRLHGVVHVAEVLQVGRCVRLDHGVGVLQELDHFVEVGVPPLDWRVSHPRHPCKVWWSVFSFVFIIIPEQREREVLVNR